MPMSLQDRQARAFRYLCAKPGLLELWCGADGDSYHADWCGPVDAYTLADGATPLDAIEACVAKIRAGFDPNWGVQCEVSSLPLPSQD